MRGIIAYEPPSYQREREINQSQGTGANATYRSIMSTIKEVSRKPGFRESQYRCLNTVIKAPRIGGEAKGEGIYPGYLPDASKPS